jgi:hypothetical protein
MRPGGSSEQATAVKDNTRIKSSGMREMKEVFVTAHRKDIPNSGSPTI